VTSLKIAFEDEWFIALEKPANYHSADLPSKKGLSIASLLTEKYPSISKVAPKEVDAGLLQRLDFETSGLLIAAKSKKAWEALHLSIKENKLEKTYLALIEGKAKTNQIVSAGIGSPNRRGKKVRAFDSSKKLPPRTLPAESIFTSLHYFPKEKVSLVEVKAITGRRHQIRAHAAYAGMPLIGDSLYGSKRTLQEVLNSETLPSFFLHAWKLNFVHPVIGEKISIFASLPIYAKQLEDLL